MRLPFSNKIKPMRNLHLAVLFCLMLTLMMSGCRRYQVKYAYVAVDSLQQKSDSDSINSIGDVLEPEEESVFEVPDIPQESSMSDIMNSREAANQVDKMYSGEELE